MNVNQLVGNQKDKPMREIVTKTIFPRIAGNDELKFVLALQLFGAETKLLIVGEPISGKSAMLRAIKPYLETYVGHKINVINGRDLSEYILYTENPLFIEDINEVPEQVMRHLKIRMMCGNPLIATVVNTGSFSPLLSVLFDLVMFTEKFEYQKVDNMDVSVNELDDLFLKAYINRNRAIHPILPEEIEAFTLIFPMYARKLAVAYACMESQVEINEEYLEVIKHIVDGE